jgi:hypothetical protein
VGPRAVLDAVVKRNISNFGISRSEPRKWIVALLTVLICFLSCPRLVVCAKRKGGGSSVNSSSHLAAARTPFRRGPYRSNPPSPRNILDHVKNCTFHEKM